VLFYTPIKRYKQLYLVVFYTQRLHTTIPGVFYTQRLDTTIPGGILHTKVRHNYTWWYFTYKGFKQLYLVVFYTQRLHTTIPGDILQRLHTTIPGGILHTKVTHNYTWWYFTHEGYTQLYLVVFYTQRLHTTIPGGILHTKVTHNYTRCILHTKVTHNYTWWYFTHKGYTQLYLVVFYTQRLHTTLPGGILHTVAGCQPYLWLQLGDWTNTALSLRHSANTSPPM